MITGFSCVNLFSVHAAESIAFYRDMLGIPVLYTLNDDTDGVNLGFIKDAPTICIWDTVKWGSPVQGATSLVFRTENLDETCLELKNKGLQFNPPVKFEFGVYELRLRDPDGNEVVVVEFLNQEETV